MAKLYSTYQHGKAFYAMLDKGDGTNIELKSTKELDDKDWIARAEKLVADESLARETQVKAEADKVLTDWQTQTKVMLAEKPLAEKETVSVWTDRVVSEKTAGVKP